MTPDKMFAAAAAVVSEEFLLLLRSTWRWYNSHGVVTLLFALLATFFFFFFFSNDGTEMMSLASMKRRKMPEPNAARGQGGASCVDVAFTLIFYSLASLFFWIHSPMMKYCPPGSGPSSARASAWNWIDFFSFFLFFLRISFDELSVGECWGRLHGAGPGQELLIVTHLLPIWRESSFVRLAFFSLSVETQFVYFERKRSD